MSNLWCLVMCFVITMLFGTWFFFFWLNVPRLKFRLSIHFTNLVKIFSYVCCPVPSLFCFTHSWGATLSKKSRRWEQRWAARRPTWRWLRPGPTVCGISRCCRMTWWFACRAAATFSSLDSSDGLSAPLNASRASTRLVLRECGGVWGSVVVQSRTVSINLPRSENFTKCIFALSDMSWGYGGRW